MPAVWCRAAARCRSARLAAGWTFRSPPKKIAPMIVMKFDAGSIGSHDRLRAVAQLVQQHKARKPVVVTSALPKVTDLLLEAADLAAARQSDYEDRVQEVKALHEQLASDLLPDGPGRRRFANHLEERLAGTPRPDMGGFARTLPSPRPR